MGWSTRVIFPEEAQVFLSAAKSRLSLGHVQQVPGAVFPGVRWPEHEPGHSFPYNAEVKNVWSFMSVPSDAFMACA